MLIFSKAPRVFCQPTSFKEVALLNQAIRFVAEPWNITASFYVWLWIEKLTWMCGKPTQTKEAAMRNKDQILIVTKIAIHPPKSASVIMLNDKNRVDGERFFLSPSKTFSSSFFLLGGRH